MSRKRDTQSVFDRNSLVDLALHDEHEKLAKAQRRAYLKGFRDGINRAASTVWRAAQSASHPKRGVLAHAAEIVRGVRPKCQKKTMASRQCQKK